ncbi:MAG: hypothetical protein OEZ22_00680 [Spirochaetia bacterium]|nr:hypothetical protein [Spirochaetia bacterium]
MHIFEYPAFLEILKNINYILRNNKNNLIYKKEAEALPESYNLSFHPILPEKTIEKIYNEKLCVSCSKRISYKENQFDDNRPKLPFLILIHNTLKKDQKYFQDINADTMFKNMIQNTLGFLPEDFLIREVLRCHFSADEIENEIWIKNCKSNIYNDIKNFKIKGILIIGDAVKFFINKTEMNNNFNKVTEVLGLPAVFSAGPNRIIYLQNKKYTNTIIKQEKLKIFNSIKLFKEKIMRI